MQENWETEPSVNSLHLLSSSPTAVPGALTAALAWSQPLRSLPSLLCMPVSVVALIITVVVIMLLDVSSLAGRGTAQTLAHNNTVFPGRQKTV